MSYDNPTGTGPAVALTIPPDDATFLRTVFKMARDGIRAELSEHPDRLREPTRVHDGHRCPFRRQPGSLPQAGRSLARGDELSGGAASNRDQPIGAWAPHPSHRHARGSWSRCAGGMSTGRRLASASARTTSGASESEGTSANLKPPNSRGNAIS